MTMWFKPSEWERTYKVKGHEVSATILESHQLSSGAIEVTVRTGCPAPDGETHYQTTTTTLTDLNGGSQLARFMEGRARWLQKLLWQKPTMKLYIAKLLKQNDEYINLPCTINVAQPNTMTDPIFIKGAEAPQVGIFRPPENTSIEIRVHRVRLQFGTRIVEADVLSVSAGASCVLGGGLVQQAAGADLDCLYQVFLSDVVRALGTAARSKRRTVLILGSYSDSGQERLSAIRNALEREGLVGVKLDDFVDIHQQSLYEKMLMFGSLSRASSSATSQLLRGTSQS